MTPAGAVPLDGIRVLEFAAVVSGPWAGLLLAQLGADVVKVEPPTGDLARSVGQPHDGLPAYFYNLNRGKRSVVLDLKTPSGREAAEALVRSADVVVENWRPGVAERLGLGAGRLREVNQRLVCVALRGFGATGPYTQGRVYDKLAQGVASLTSIQHGPQRPELLETPVADKVAALAVVQAVLGALFRRERTGLGATVEVNLLDPLLAFVWPDVMTEVTFADVPPAKAWDTPPYALVRAGDGGWVAVTAVSPAEWQGLATTVGVDLDAASLPGLDQRMQQWPRVLAALETFAAGHPRASVIERLGDAGVPAGPVNTPQEVLDDPQVEVNRSYREVRRAGLGRVREAAPLAKLDGAEVELGPAPRLGEHTDEVLRETGLADGQIDKLRADGALG